MSEPKALELVYPECVRRRKLDMQEVHAMLEAGEVEIAIDELRWLLAGCDELLEAHQLLGELALADGALDLARAHLGYAWELGLQAIPQGFSGALPYRRPANRPFLKSGGDLVRCLSQQGHAALAQTVRQQLLMLDPSDPLHVRELDLPSKESER